MKDQIVKHIKQRFQSYRDLAESLSDASMNDRLDVPKDKSVGEHFWCVIGARESYTKGLEDGAWPGFTCSLMTLDQASILEKLDASAAKFDAVVSEVKDWTDERTELLTMLLEHEVMHEGQMIRQAYGLGRTLPDSVHWA